MNMEITVKFKNIRLNSFTAMYYIQVPQGKIMYFIKCK